MRFSLLFTIAVGTLGSTTPHATVTVFELAKNILNIVQNVTDISEFTERYHFSQEKVFEKLDNLILDINELSERLKKTGNNLDMIKRLSSSLNEIRIKQQFLNQYFTKMEEYVLDYENSTILQDFANKVVSTKENSVPKLMDSIQKKLTEGEFLEHFSQLFKPGLDSIAQFCKEGQSLSQVLQNFLNEVLLLKTKSFVLIQMAYILQKMYKNDSEDQVKYTLQDFQESTNTLVRAFKPYADNASLELWKCDPKEHVEGTTFVQLKNFLHGFILNKVNIDPDGSCSSECDTYKYITKMDCRDNNWCKDQTECPLIVQCRYVDQSMTVYPLSVDSTNRRYDHIDFANGLKYGKNNISSDGWDLETYNEWLIRRCSYCFCLCDEGSKFFSEKYINMRLTTSNFTANKVVTGLRFIKHNGIIHLQIQEGKVLEKGKIDVDTIRWVPPHNYSRADENVREGTDYHTFSWHQRGFQLKDSIANDGYVITGVRVLKSHNQLYLEPLVTRYDFSTGKLGRTHFHEDQHFDVTRKFAKKLELFKPDIPIRSSWSNVITTDKYLEFTHSDFEKDAGQTTVPFFDAQPVESAVPVPLTGIGVFHRGRLGYGGFIAPRIFTYNFTQHLTNRRP